MRKSRRTQVLDLQACSLESRQLLCTIATMPLPLANNTAITGPAVNGTVLPATLCTVPAGTAIADSATISGDSDLSGYVTFNLYQQGRTGPAVFTDTEPLVNGTAVSQTTVVPAGNYYWLASYSGDAETGPITSDTYGGTVVPTELVTVVPVTPIISTVQSPPAPPVVNLTAFVAMQHRTAVLTNALYLGYEQYVKHPSEPSYATVLLSKSLSVYGPGYGETLVPGTRVTFEYGPKEVNLLSRIETQYDGPPVVYRPVVHLPLKFVAHQPIEVVYHPVKLAPKPAPRLALRLRRA